MAFFVPTWARALLLVTLGRPASAFLVGVDLGSQFMKIALVSPGKPFEVVINRHSKRKTPTAVSFLEAVRTFGDDAVTASARGVYKAPMFFSHQLGRNFTGEELSWLPQSFYPYKLGRNDSGSLKFEVGDELAFSVEEVAAHVLGLGRSLAEDVASDGSEARVPVSESVLTIPSSATMLQRQALLNAAEIAGLPRAKLIHETSAAALQRAPDLALDLAPDVKTPDANGTEDGKDNATDNATAPAVPPAAEEGPPKSTTVLYYNMGARHAEACLVHYVGAKHLGKPTTAMRVLGCGVSDKVGGHHADLIIAAQMLEAFKAKHPKLADGVTGSARAMKKLEKEATGTKHVLSANKDAQFRVESLYEDTDFMQPVSRETFEGWCSSLFGAIREPIDGALAASQLTLDAVEVVELVGGGWRIPKVQGILGEILAAGRSPDAPALTLSQHLNGEEAMATGAAFFGANNSKSFRTKKIFFQDVSPHAYSWEVTSADAPQGEDAAEVRSFELFAAGSVLGSRKTVKLANQTRDVTCTILENGVPVARWDFLGIRNATTEGPYASLPAPLVSLKVELDSSGVLRLQSATAIFDEPAPVKLPPSTPNASAPNASAEGEAATQTTTDAEPAAAATPEETNTTVDGDAKAKKPKIIKRKVPLVLAERFDGVHPRPLGAEEKQFAKERLRQMNEADLKVQQTDAAKNALEAFVYESREKLSDDEACIAVSTEENRDQVREMLSKTEDWLYDEGSEVTDMEVFYAKLKELQEHVFPIRGRAYEYQQRPELPETVEKVLNYVNQTLDYVEKNMTWVASYERESVANLSVAFETWYANVTQQQASLALTDEPAFKVGDAKRQLQHMAQEAQRLTKIQKIQPRPYEDDYYRSYYDSMFRNFSRNGTNFSDWWKRYANGSNGSGFNESDYMRSFYEQARNAGAGGAPGGADSGDAPGGPGASGTGAGEEPPKDPPPKDGAEL